MKVLKSYNGQTIEGSIYLKQLLPVHQKQSILVLYWMMLWQLFPSELSNTAACTTTRINWHRIMAGQIGIC